MQADPFIQFADDTQSYNRYSYVMNNPLNGTDPSGYFLKDLVKIVAVAAIAYFTAGLVSTWAMSAGLYSSVTVGVTVTQTLTMGGAILAGAAGGFAAGVASAAFSGASGSDLFKAGLRGAVSGAVFGGIGASGLGDSARVGAHAIAGGTMNVLQGGKFGHGFISAGLTKLASLKVISNIKGDGWDKVIGRTTIASVVGGTASEISGGKFANGASTAAFVYLMSAAAEYYEKAVGRKADPLPGENKPGKTDYQFDKNGRQYPDSHDQNVIGLNKPMSGDFLDDLPKQGGPVSKALNVVPTVNATAALHDYWFNDPNGLQFNLVTNVGTMLPAAGISMAASIGNYTRGNEAMIMTMYHLDSQRRRRLRDE